MISRQNLARLPAIVAVVGIGVYVWIHHEEFASLRIVEPVFLVLCFLGTGGSLLATTWLNFSMLRRLGCRVSLGESWWLCVVATTANLLTPARAGAGIRAVYLKRVHGLSYGSFVATLFGYYVVSLLVCALAACGCLGWLAYRGGAEGIGPVLGIAALAAVSCAGLMFVPYVRSERNWLFRKVAAVTSAWHELRSEPRFLLRTLGLALGQFAAFVLSFRGACLVLGIELGPVEVTAVAALGCLSTFVSITPGSLGFYEAVIAFTAFRFGVSPVASLGAALLTRAVLVVCLTFLTLPGTRWLARYADRREENGGTSCGDFDSLR